MVLSNANDLFEREMGPQRVQPLPVGMELGIISGKWHSRLLRATERKPHHQMSEKDLAFERHRVNVLQKAEDNVERDGDLWQHEYKMVHNY